MGKEGLVTVANFCLLVRCFDPLFPNSHFIRRCSRCTWPPSSSTAAAWMRRWAGTFSTHLLHALHPAACWHSPLLPLQHLLLSFLQVLQFQHASNSHLFSLLNFPCLSFPFFPEQVDVYALGVILNECYTRRQPWKDSQHFFQIILKTSSPCS